jgi:NADPH-dependent glutamate synthase beta subunit-like oxidoreductase/NAD(P)H-flavin reductase
MAQNTDFLKLHIDNFNFHDLFNPHKLSDLTKIFFDEVRAKDPKLFRNFEEYRKTKGAGMSGVEVSKRIVELAPFVDDFVIRLFGVEDEARTVRLRTNRERVIFAVKKDFFIRRALKNYSKSTAQNLPLAVLDAQVQILSTLVPALPQDDSELTAAGLIAELLEKDKVAKIQLTDDLRRDLKNYCDRLNLSNRFSELLTTTEGDELKFLSGLLSICEQWLAGHYYVETASMKEWAMFRVPHQIDYQHLVDYQEISEQNHLACVGPEEHYRRRDGFDLTDSRLTPREVMSEVDYCIFCHDRDKDSCSKGFREKDGFKTNPLGYSLQGCPLDQKISESHFLKNHGYLIGALATIAIDNPMCPGTGHRICNDCMKACIYQKQDPVNIPQIETGILTEVLNLPWGFEIYSLLTRWNPLNVESPHALPYNGRKILIVGTGPAGYTLAHYFLNAGFGVVSIDALKIEPLPAELVGDGKMKFKPVKEYASMYHKLSERVLLGFGGVSEYGITVRWDKNFLTLIYLNLLRQTYFRLYDGVRFGGTMNLEDAWDLGFDHVCLATGAGKPTFVSMKNNLIRGMRKASDFLMALQLTGAGKIDSMANLQVQLPAVVIGGGLTAIDTATELMAYYPVQVTKIKYRFDNLCTLYGRDAVEAMFNPEEREILKTFLSHAEEIGAERNRTEKAKEKPDFIPLIRKWGGVHIYYRKSLTDSPAYRLNHEEIIKGFEEGISFVENMSPCEAVPDQYGAVKEMVFERMASVSGKWKKTGEVVRVPARSVMVAAGTSPNVMYEREHPDTFELDERDEFFASYVMKGTSTGEFVHEKAVENDIGFFTSYASNGKYVSYYGDNHPVFEGNVVKAMASAKYGFKKVLSLFEKSPFPENADKDTLWPGFVEQLDRELKPYVVRVDRLTPTIVEIVLHAPRAARKFQPGQFYRLQNYETDSPRVENTLLMMEGMALTGAWVDKGKGLLSLIVLEFGSSSRMCSMLKPGQRVVVMGPTGAPTEISENSTVLLLGGGLGNAVLFSIAKAFNEKKNRVIYFAGYRKKDDLFKREEIESATDLVVYSVDSGKPIETKRPQDKSFVGNIVQAMVAYATGKLGDTMIPLGEASRVIAIGSDRMMEAVTTARHSVLQPYLDEHHVGIASVNSPMQCMMKAVCAQCLQRHIIPGTKEEVFVFSCFNQDQKMDEVDFNNLSSRLKANSLMEKISNRWFDYILEKNHLSRI